MTNAKPNNLFSRWLDITMENEELTNRDLAAKVGVHDSVVSRWRAGKSVPGMDNCTRLAEALGVDFARLAVTAGLMDGERLGIAPLPLPEPTAIREHVVAQIARIKGLTDKSRAALIAAFDESIRLEGNGS